MRLEISCQDRLGITQDILDILVTLNIDLRGIEIAPGGKIFLNFPNIAFSDFQQLMPKIRRITGIEDVKTTAFMPQEREQNQLKALINTLPDPVLSIDAKGRVLLSNDACSTSLQSATESLVGNNIDDCIQGFNVNRWLEQEDICAKAQKVRFMQQEFLADFLPVLVPDTDDRSILAGAVVILRSEFRLGQQLNQFHQSHTDSFSSVVASSPAMKKVVRQVKRFAELDAPVLLFGESGSGKELLARACHAAGRRKMAPFHCVNCANIDIESLGVALFDVQDQRVAASVSEQVKGGTFYLSNIDQLPQSLQPTLLALVQRATPQRSGAAAFDSADVRIICSTGEDLGALVESGQFSAELYFQLNVLSIIVPPLRERKGDVLLLAERFVRQHSQKLGVRMPKLTDCFASFLQTYPWPGNVRQLEHALYRAVSLSDSGELSKADLQVPRCTVAQSMVVEEFEGSLERAVKDYERDILQRLYPSYPSTRQLASKLGLSHTAIANKLREYGISKKPVKI